MLECGRVNLVVWSLQLILFFNFNLNVNQLCKFPGEIKIQFAAGKEIETICNVRGKMAANKRCSRSHDLFDLQTTGNKTM